MSAPDRDVIVIGVGTAGSRAARAAHEAGARVLAIEGGERLGGLCILRGCMPTKTMLESAHRLSEARDGARFGLRGGEGVTLDFAAHLERTRGLVERFARAKVSSIESGGYELRMGRPRFRGPNELELDGERLTARAFVIATGSRTSPLPWAVPRGVRVLDSDDLFELEAPPARTIVFGAGAVGLEFAQWLARVGSRVTLVNRSALLSRSDPEAGSELCQALLEELDVLAPAEPEHFEAQRDGSVIVRVRDAKGAEHRVHADALLNATGRVPDVEGLALEALGFGSDASPTGDDAMRTTLPHVFVAGDVAPDRPRILHEANVEGAIAGRNAARVALGTAGELERYPADLPRMEVIFTDPPFATVGATPVALRERRGVRSATKRFPEQGRGIVMGARHGFVRFSADDEGRLLGAQILGPRADDLIHLPGLAIRLGLRAEDLIAGPWYHPTLSEALLDVVRALAAPVD